jgi:uncharacterized protein YecT (DUF1311 family)
MKWSVARCWIAFAGAAALLPGQTSPPRSEKNWREVCAAAIAAPLTLPTFSPATPEAELRRCDSTALYFGFDHSANPGAALECGYYQRSHAQPTVGDPFLGPGILTMLYANGLGVARDYDLAIRFACENTWVAPAEMELRIGHLEQLRATHAAATNFDLCDDGTSGLMEGACESIRQQVSDVRRTQELDRISVSWTPQTKTAFAPLRTAEEAFVAARSGKEIDLSGTGRGAFSLAEKGRLHDQFLINLRHFADPKTPSAAAADLQTADFQSIDRQLNQAYQRIQQAPDRAWQYGTVKAEGIRSTQEVWLKLRDAWVEFAGTAYPRLKADTVRTQITRLRVHQLHSLEPK